MVEEILFEVFAEFPKDHLNLSTYVGVDHPEVKFGGDGLADPIRGKDSAQALDQIRPTCARFTHESNVPHWLDRQIFEPAEPS